MFFDIEKVQFNIYHLLALGGAGILFAVFVVSQYLTMYETPTYRLECKFKGEITVDSAQVAEVLVLNKKVLFKEAETTYRIAGQREPLTTSGLCIQTPLR